MESASGSDVRWPRVGDVGLGHMARQEFAHGRSRWCGGAGAWQRGEGVGHATSLPDIT